MFNFQPENYIFFSTELIGYSYIEVSKPEYTNNTCKCHSATLCIVESNLDENVDITLPICQVFNTASSDKALAYLCIIMDSQEVTYITHFECHK